MSKGYGPAIEHFYKINKGVYNFYMSEAWDDGHSSVDDSYLQANTCKLCLDNVMVTFQTLRSLGLLYTQESQSSSQSKLLHAYDLSYPLPI